MISNNLKQIQMKSESGYYIVLSIDQGFKADPLLIGGKPAERGAYPWVS